LCGALPNLAFKSGEVEKGETQGFMKILADPDSGEILGEDIS
jgi:hypothetical protein